VPCYARYLYVSGAPDARRCPHRGRQSFFSTAANLHLYHTILVPTPYTFTSDPLTRSFRAARHRPAPPPPAVPLSNAFAARRQCATSAVRRITTPPCVKPPTNPNPNHVSHLRTSGETLKLPSSQIGSARFDVPSMRHACTHSSPSMQLCGRTHAAAMMPEPNVKKTVRRRVDLDRWIWTSRTTTIVETH
jgi:hypothetical protein